MNKKISFLIFIISLFLMTFCNLSDNDSDEVKEPGETDASPLTDVIPFDSMGRGKIVFKRVGPSGEYSVFYVLDIDNNRTLRFDLGAADWPSISPSGQKIIFTMYSGSETAWDVHIMNIDGTNIRNISNLNVQDNCPSWTSDGSKILFWIGIPGPTKLYLQSPVPNPADRRIITEFGVTAPSGAVSTSLNGKIVYVTIGGPIPGICTIDMDGSNFKLLIPYPTYSGDRYLESPIFSPDGEKIAYIYVIRDSGSEYQAIEVMVVDKNGNDPVLLTSLEAGGRKEWDVSGQRNAVTICWSPDGSKLLFTVPKEDFVSHIYG